MTNYRTMQLFLTACEYDEAQAALARVARRITFNDRERAAKDRELLAAMKCKELLAEEIQKLEGKAA